jgi:hypothetical protein
LSIPVVPDSQNLFACVRPTFFKGEELDAV